MRCINFKSVFLVLVCIFGVSGCSDEFSSVDRRLGPNGEPPKAFSQVYKEQFISSERNYVTALGMIHSYLIDNQYYPEYTSCLNDVLDVTKRKKGFACLVVKARKGAPEHNYLLITIDEVLFNQLDGNNRFKYTIEMHAHGGDTWNTNATLLAESFKKSVRENLISLYAE